MELNLIYNYSKRKFISFLVPNFTATEIKNITNGFKREKARNSIALWEYPEILLSQSGLDHMKKQWRVRLRGQKVEMDRDEVFCLT